MTAAGDVVTTNGQKLTARMLEAIDSAYRAAGLDPATYRVVTQGSYKAGGGASASGSTHDKAGAADLRTWNLPASAQANLCQVLVVELRKRLGLAVWYRDQTHGGMDPHIHAVMRDESPLSSGAAQQVRDADAGLNGLSNKGRDYHPRPTWTPYTYRGTTSSSTTPTTGRTDDVFLASVKYGTNSETHWVVSATGMVNVSSTIASSWTGTRLKVTDEATWVRMTKAWPQKK